MRFHRFVILSLVTWSVLLLVGAQGSDMLKSNDASHLSSDPSTNGIASVAIDQDTRVKIATKHFNKKHAAATASHQRNHNMVAKKKLSGIRDIDVKHFYSGRSGEFAAAARNMSSVGAPIAGENVLSPGPLTVTTAPVVANAAAKTTLLSSDGANSVASNADILTTAVLESTSSAVSSVVVGADKIMKQALRRLHNSVVHALDGTTDDDTIFAPVKPKPKPKPVPLPPSPRASSPVITSNDVVEDKIYSNDLVPYQHFGHSVLSVKNHLFVSTAIPSSLKDNKIYVFNLNVSFVAISSSTNTESTSPSEGTENHNGESSSTQPSNPAEDDNGTNDEQQDSASDGESSVATDRRLKVSSTNSANATISRTMMQALSSESNNNYDGYGLSMSSDGNWVAVGAPYDDTKGYLAGKVYIYRYQSESGQYLSTKTQPFLVSTSTFPMGTMYGSSVSNAANFLAIGAPGESVYQRLFAGAVHLYSFDAVTGIWSLMEILHDEESTTSNYERFGSTVIMLDNEGEDSSSDAPTSEVTLVVSAIGKSNGEGNSDAGAVFIYYSSSDGTVDSVATTSWKLQQVLSPSSLQTRAYFGYSMAFTNEFGAIAAYSEDNSGVVYLYRSKDFSASPSGQASSSLRSLQGSDIATSSYANRQWILQQAFYPSDAGQGMDNQFGSSLAIRQSVRYELDDSSFSLSTCVRRRHVLVVGAHGDSSLNTDAGAVYIFASDESKDCTSSSSSTSSTSHQTEEANPSTLSVSKKSKRAKADGDWQVVAKFTCEDHKQFNAYGRSVQMMHFISPVERHSDTEISQSPSDELTNMETTILFVGAELANSPQVNNSGVVYLEQNTLTYLLEEYTIQEETASQGGNDPSTFWERLQAMFYSSAGYVTMAFLPSALFVVCVMFHFHQKHQLNKKNQTSSNNSVEMLAIESWARKNRASPQPLNDSHNVPIPTSNSQDETDDSHNMVLKDHTAPSSLYDKLRAKFNFTSLFERVTDTRRGHTRSASNISSISSASGHSAYKQVSKSEHGDGIDDCGQEEEEANGVAAQDLEFGHEDRTFVAEVGNANGSSKKSSSVSHKRRTSHSSNGNGSLEIEIPEDATLQQVPAEKANEISPMQGASMDQIYPNNEQLLSPIMMQNLLHQQNVDGVPFSDQWVKSSSIKSPQQVFADYRFVPTTSDNNTIGGNVTLPNSATVHSSFGTEGHHHFSKDAASDSHSVSSSETKHSHHSHGSTLSKVKKLLQKFSHPHGGGSGGTHKKRRSLSSNGSDLVFNPLPLENVEEGAESEHEVHENQSYPSKHATPTNDGVDEEDEEDRQGKPLQSSLSL